MPFETATRAEPAGSLADYTRNELIVPRLDGRDAAGILGELSRVLGRSDCVADALSFYQAALNQELLSDSVVRSEVAVAHGRLSGVNRLQFALGRSPAPVVWSARDSCPVRLVFLLAVPATESARYLQLLSRLARLGREAGAVQNLLLAADAPGMLEILRDARLRSAGQPA